MINADKALSAKYLLHTAAETALIIFWMKDRSPSTAEFLLSQMEEDLIEAVKRLGFTLVPIVETAPTEEAKAEETPSV